MPLWELGLTQRSKQQFWWDCPEWFSLTFIADLWNVFMRFVTFCACLISSKPIISLTNLICRDDNLTTIVDSFRQGFLAESRSNHIVELVGSTEKHSIFYIFYISFNLLFPCIILRRARQSNLSFPLFFHICPCCRLCSAVLLFDLIFLSNLHFAGSILCI